METSIKPSMDGTEGVETQGNKVQLVNRKTVRSSDFLLRFLAMATSLVAIIVLVTSKETKTVPVTVLPSLPPIDIEVTAKWQYMSAFVYFMVANSIALAYAVISLVLSIANRTATNGLGLLLFILDLVVMSLLISANGAASGVGFIGIHGNSHVRWNKICNVFGTNCRHVAASIVVSSIGALMFSLIIILTVMNLRKRCY